MRMLITYFNGIRARQLSGVQDDRWCLGVAMLTATSARPADTGRRPWRHRIGSNLSAR